MSWPPNPTFGFFRRLVCSVSGFVGAWQIGCMAPCIRTPPLLRSGSPPRSSHLDGIYPPKQVNYQ